MTEPEEYALQAAADAYYDEIIQEALKGISLDGISAYVSKYGDAIEARIADLLGSASKLLDLKHYGPSLTCSCTAIEVIIRYFLLAPLLQGALLSDKWAETLTERIATGRYAKYREVLPAITKFRKVDLNQVKTAAGDPLWKLLNDSLWQARNGYVHKGNPVTENQARQGMECADRLRQMAEEVLSNAGVSPIAASPERKAQLGWVGKWSPDGAKESPFHVSKAGASREPLGERRRGRMQRPEPSNDNGLAGRN